MEYQSESLEIAFNHSLIQFRSKLIKEIGTAVRLTMFHIHIDIVAVVLDFYSEDFGKGVSQFFYTDFSVVDTVAGIKSLSVNEIEQSLICGITKQDFLRYPPIL